MNHTPLVSTLRGVAQQQPQVTRLALADAATFLRGSWQWVEGGLSLDTLIYEAGLARLSGDHVRLNALPLHGLFRISYRETRLLWSVSSAGESTLSLKLVPPAPSLF